MKCSCCYFLVVVALFVCFLRRCFVERVKEINLISCCTCGMIIRLVEKNNIFVF